MEEDPPKTKNYLWLARKRKSLRLKQVARLLEHRTVDQVSRYENGSRLPTLKNAMKLEIIYGLPIRELLKDLHAQFCKDIRTRAGSGRRKNEIASDLVVGDYCSYRELLDRKPIPLEIRQEVHRHAASLINKMNLSDTNNEKEGLIT